MEKYYFSKSKRFAIGIFIATFILSVYALYKEMGEVIMTIFPSGTLSSVGLYGNKQYQARKELEVTNKAQ
jgi:hypothetical protein